MKAIINVIGRNSGFPQNIVSNEALVTPVTSIRWLRISKRQMLYKKVNLLGKTEVLH